MKKLLALFLSVLMLFTLTACAKEDLDLAILDIMMPDISGLTLCQMIREKYTFPVIMLTAKDREIDKITGLTMGADDYVTKPFRPLELMARVKAHLRRYKTYSGRQENTEGILSHAGLMLNIHTHECTLNGQVLTLTPTEFSIFAVRNGCYRAQIDGCETKAEAAYLRSTACRTAQK